MKKQYCVKYDTDDEIWEVWEADWEDNIEKFDIVSVTTAAPYYDYETVYFYSVYVEAAKPYKALEKAEKLIGMKQCKQQ